MIKVWAVMTKRRQKAMRNTVAKLIMVTLVASVLSGCGGVRKNVAYFPSGGEAAKLPGSVKVVVLPVVDARESAKIYPKQIISHTSYYGEKTFDINDKPVEDVFGEALAAELYNLGVGVVRAADMDVRLDKENKDRAWEQLRQKYPDAGVAVGMKVVNFMAYSKRNLLSTDVKFTAAVQLNVMDLTSGKLLWADYKTEKTDTVLSAGRNYMVEELSAVMSDVMKKAVKDNLTLRDVLVGTSGR